MVFQNNHGFTIAQTGLSFLGMDAYCTAPAVDNMVLTCATPGLLVGMLTGIASDPIWRKRYDAHVQANGGQSEPEFRLPSTICGAILVPIGLFGEYSLSRSLVHLCSRSLQVLAGPRFLQ